jgi:hypothetical protein
MLTQRETVQGTQRYAAIFKALDRDRNRGIDFEGACTHTHTPLSQRLPPLSLLLPPPPGSQRAPRVLTEIWTHEHTHTSIFPKTGAARRRQTAVRCVRNERVLKQRSTSRPRCASSRSGMWIASSSWWGAPAHG